MSAKERPYLRDFIKQAKKEDFFVHKDGDVYGGHKKLYDFYMVHKGWHFAIEAKWDDEPLRDHQRDALVNVHTKGGGLTFVARFKFNADHSRDIHFKYFTYGIEHQPTYILKWEHKAYKDIGSLPDNLVKLAAKTKG